MTGARSPASLDRMKVRLTSRRSANARCAYCHDSLDGAVSSCPSCLTTFHRDCRSHLAQCPTLGCNTAFTHVPDVIIEADQPVGLAAELVTERIGLAAMVVAPAGALAALGAMLGWGATLGVAAAIIVPMVLWAAWLLARELPFYGALPLLLGRAPVRMSF